MTDLETKLAEGRGRYCGDVDFEVFDAAAAIAREVVAEKDAEIARLKQLLEIERAASSRRTHRGCFG
jgi:hypothetical protein